jgi:hypothetical protein
MRNQGNPQNLEEGLGLPEKKSKLKRGKQWVMTSQRIMS